MKKSGWKKFTVAVLLVCVLAMASACSLFGLTINALYPAESPAPPTPTSAPPSEEPVVPPAPPQDVLKPNPIQSPLYPPHLISEEQREAEPYRYYRDGRPVSGVAVSTSEELFNAADTGRGFQPVSGSAAERILNAAYDVLDKILLNGMTEYERAHAIYDWLINAVEYDYELLEKYEKNPYDPSLDNDPAFRMEGVFDDRVAVCDGISKAYALLCRIEHIECIQVVGVSGDVGHAWNKVYLHKPEYRNCAKGLPNQTMCTDPAHRAWYGLDATWGNIAVEYAGGREECLTHAYFLISDAALADGHTELPQQDANLSEYPEAVASYGYFNYAKIAPADGAPSARVTNFEQLYAVLEYAAENALTGIEIECAVAERDLSIFQRMKLSKLVGAAYNGSVEISRAMRVYLLEFDFAAAA